MAAKSESGQVAEEVREFLGRDLFFDLLGHHREFADLVDLDLVAGNGLLCSVAISDDFFGWWW